MKDDGIIELARRRFQRETVPTAPDHDPQRVAFNVIEGGGIVDWEADGWLND